MVVTTRPAQKVRLTDLRPHPRQTELFPAPNDTEIELLAEDMRTRGLQHPIEILPDNTILCGHNRVRAAELLGWEEIDAIVRHDLMDATDQQIEMHVIIDNTCRRQLRPLERARCAHRLRELFHGGDFEQLAHDDQDDVVIHTRDLIGRMMKLSGRHVSRLMAVLDTPLAVQQACDDGLLSVELAARIAKRPGDVQAKIAEKIRGGADPKKVAQRYLRRGREPTEAEKVYNRLFAALGAAAEAFEDGFSEVRVVDVVDDPSTTLRQSVPMLEALADYVECRMEEQAANLEDRVGSIGQLLTNAPDVE